MRFVAKAEFRVLRDPEEGREQVAGYKHPGVRRDVEIFTLPTGCLGLQNSHKCCLETENWSCLAAGLSSDGSSHAGSNLGTEPSSPSLSFPTCKAIVFKIKGGSESKVPGPCQALHTN